MTGFPISYPKVDGPGRLLELCSFHRSKITEERYDKVFNEISEITSKFPISRQSLTGKKQSTEQLMTVLIADWTSAEEKDLFEPGERYQSIKPAFGELVLTEDPGFACHHVILSGEHATPEAETYVMSFYHVEPANLPNFATKFDGLASNLVQDHGATFIHGGPSREDPNVVVSVSGWRNPKDAKDFIQKKPHHDEVFKNLCEVTGVYEARLEKWVSSKSGN